MTSRPPSSCMRWKVAMYVFVGRVERHFGDPWVRLSRVRNIDPALGGEHDERRLGRIADDLPVGDRRVTAERHRQRIGSNCGSPSPATRRIRPSVEYPPDRPSSGVVGEDELASRHLIQGQRSGLVGADRRGRAEGLDRPQPLDDRALFRELLRAERAASSPPPACRSGSRRLPG